jgi:hypothetical protein
MRGKMMMSKKNLLLRVLFVLVIVSLVCAASLSATTGEVEITGVIFLPNSPDVEDMYPVVFVGERGEMYAVSMDGKCVELIEHENKLVKVIGIVSIDKNGGKSITVKHYEVLKE